MKINVLLQIEDVNEDTVEVLSDEEGNKGIFITANTLETAKELLESAEKQLDNAPLIDDHEEGQEEDQEENYIDYMPYIVAYPKSEKDMEKEANEFINTEEGKELINKLNKALLLEWERPDSALMTAKELNFFANKHKNSLIDGYFDISMLAYWEGYQAGKKKS